MKLVSLTLENFRAYQTPTTIHLSDLTTIIGRNDIGKSCLLEALEIFFNGDVVRIDQADANVFSSSQSVRITAEFSDLPDEITLDAGAPTTLSDEHLLTTTGTLKIEKVYDCSKKTPTCEAFIVAMHPNTPGLHNLLELKEKDLQTLVKAQALDCPLKGNPGMRRALWDACPHLGLEETRIPVSKPKEDSKRIWEQLELHLPVFALFQSDRQSRDSDGEVQNPMKGALAAAISEAQEAIDAIQKLVQAKTEEIAKLTHDALKSIDPKLASSLSPKFVPPTAAKWMGLFSLGMDTDASIPLNKRGSGVRRLILVSFFKAEAERKLSSSAKRNLIYAIEEPETSQHPANQRILIDAFKQIAATPHCQVILTTHSPGLAADLPIESIRFVSSEGPPATPSVKAGVNVFEEVANALGLIPDSRVRVLIFVEGPTDVIALRYLSAALHAEDETIPNLMTDERFAFIPAGGSTLKHWVTEHYLRNMRRPEVHIYDSDVAKYAASVNEVNERTDGLRSCAFQTQKHEIECYLHSDAIKAAFGVDVVCVDHPADDLPSVPEAFASAFSAKQKFDGTMGADKAKKHLSSAFRHMTAAQIHERDPTGEVVGWFRKMSALV
ncbi:Predicted ATP-dependent endonuclease of the OLD family, contains P-loop ATPase and TOPRIM domains [Pseudoxanthobacter soli DSM 19599]|uniref:Predicted ATP-dependent endonuclease of the OLD family, contains P-loop ATPase and TOPRIM domains n=1 Tax=Pseudoxanthobacter soli DSM 19599 TaxID=1123029 RepID=A0A1M7ZMA5_9HYPH|nr:AAA family ATPase [Pseudoxanthobacter soli]SHO65786.1 Predicted ATP-dependent endonuclease of the OLD family, contains P-loop ATPase and TOPRIM domains [Pseudoxanthobacter soli DSM 19599]